jgi:hypothetical protein
MATNSTAAQIEEWNGVFRSQSGHPLTNKAFFAEEAEPSRQCQLPDAPSVRTYPLLDGVNLAASPICRFL